MRQTSEALSFSFLFFSCIFIRFSDHVNIFDCVEVFTIGGMFMIDWVD